MLLSLLEKVVAWHELYPNTYSVWFCRYVELRYDLGDGPAILRSASRVSAGKTHQIVAKRYNRDGLLRVDVRGTSPGTMKSLNLDHGGYMGYVPLNSTK